MELVNLGLLVPTVVLSVSLSDHRPGHCEDTSGPHVAHRPLIELVIELHTVMMCRQVSPRSGNAEMLLSAKKKKKEKTIPCAKTEFVVFLFLKKQQNNCFTNFG